jgi:signal transduction histidine kinase
MSTGASLSSFRVQMALFIAAMLLITTIALQLINQRLQWRITQQVEAHFEQIALAVDIVLQSRSSENYLYEFVPQVRDNKLKIGVGEIVRQILVTDGEGKILDSTTPDDNRQAPQHYKEKISSEISELPPVWMGNLLDEAVSDKSRQLRTITLSTETVGETQNDVRVRRFIIVVSLEQLTDTIRATSRDRLLATLALGLLMIMFVINFSRRFTRPITQLAAAAQRITAGDLGFQVRIFRGDEIGMLARTFNEMIAGLRNKHELEEQLQRAERSAVVGRLASGIAHEIRNPLNFINLSIDYLRDKFAPSEKPLVNVSAGRAEYTGILTTIKDEIARLNTLVTNFLSYGRPARLKLREVNALTILEDVVALVRTQAEQQGVRIEIEKVQAEGPESNAERFDNLQLKADAELIKTCFSNLVINAVQAMPEGGRLQITLRPLPAAVSLTFADTGCGIAPEALAQIFEPYYSTKETGIGLGLPLTRKLIEDHGGSITVTSIVDEGTIFIITLLRDPEKTKEP